MSSEVELTPGTVRFEHISKRYPIAKRAGALRQALPGSLGHRPPLGRTALDDVDLAIRPGETIGIIGPNGAGKSTMLKLLAGVVHPTSGRVLHGGRVGSMIELGLGFHPDLTGWENLQVGAVLLGLSRRELLARADEIIAFAQLEDAMDTPIKHYSTGMAARLGFSLATHIDADVLAVDEVLAVGDRSFQERCMERIATLVEGGCTVMFVSHELPLVNLLCERVVRLEDGRIIDDGPATDVIEAYLGRAENHLMEGAPFARITALDLHESRIEPFGQLDVDLEIEIDAVPDAEPSLAVSLTMPSIRPGISIADCIAELPIDWSRPGRQRLRGVTTPLPLAGGDLRFGAALRGKVRQDLSVSEVDFAINGSNRIVKPMYVLDPTVQVTPIEAPSASAPARGAAPVGPVVVRLRGVSKRFRTGTHRAALRQALPGRFGRARGGDCVALDDLDLDVFAGQALGVIGPNGAGKTSLLKAITGLYELDAGTIETFGRVVSVHELGVGFHPDLTGRENLAVSAAMHGMTAAELESRIPAILDFAGIGDAIDTQVKRYSTGMRARLGFALVTHVPADVVLIDELLAVGDEEFRAAARRRIRELTAAGAAIIFVSHNLPLVAEVCQRIVRLEAGRLVEDGETGEVMARYGGVGWSAGASMGTGPVRLHDVTIADLDHRAPRGVRFSCELEITEAVPHARLELSLRDPDIGDRSQPRTPEAIERLTGALAILVDEGDLPGPGWYRVDGTTGSMLCDGRLDLTLSVIDGRDGEALTETWGLARFGDGRKYTVFDFEVDWRRVEVGAEDPVEVG